MKWLLLSFCVIFVLPSCKKEAYYPGKINFLLNGQSYSLANTGSMLIYQFNTLDEFETDFVLDGGPYGFQFIIFGIDSVAPGQDYSNTMIWKQFNSPDMVNFIQIDTSDFHLYITRNSQGSADGTFSGVLTGPKTNNTWGSDTITQGVFTDVPVSTLTFE